ncbi:MAG TPA: TonB-dependent receptor [Xanthomonadales bacterium]|nr:TonB-dependent receptor [Xanthomonadales bacterium]
MSPPLLGSRPVLAQSEMAIEEVVVTARKREENLQEVPDSITAFSAQQIEERRIEVLDDAVNYTPNMHIVNDQDAATNIVTIRGIGTNRNLAASIAYVVDGVILPDSDAFTADLSDVERIEVLKGPQGALYGRNAIGGVVSLITRRPGEEFESRIKGGFSNGDTVDLFGAVGGALAADNLFARVTVKYHNTDGLIDNRFTGESLDHDETTKITGRMIWEATDTFSLDLRASWFDQDAGAAWYSTADVLGTTGGKLTEEFARVLPDQNELSFSRREISDISLVADWRSDAGTFTSITAYDEIDFLFQQDLDYNPFTLAKDTQQSRDVQGISQEFRFTSNEDAPLRYIVGAYYQQTDRDLATSTNLDFCFLLPLQGCPTPPGQESGFLTFLPLNTLEGNFDQWAIFGQANYDLTEQLELSVALRYDRDDRSQYDLLSGRTDSATFEDWQPKVSLAWQQSDNLMLYGTYAEGYKSGAFNPPPPPGASFPLVVEQEGSDGFEAGMKSTWAERRLLLNLALFYTDYTDVQIFALDLSTGGQVALNADEAEIKGGEVELVAIPAEGWELSASYGYTNAEFTDFNGTGLFDGNSLPNAPESTLNLGARYEHPLADDKSLISRLDYRRTGKIYYAEDNLIYQPSFDTVDAMISLQGERWTVSLWGKNIFDERYVTSAFSRWVSPLIFGTLGVDIIQINEGVRYGIDLTWDF